jgi:hypothetical protein
MVLESFQRGEELRVGVEIVGVGCAIEHRVRAPLLDEQMLEGDRLAVRLHAAQEAWFKLTGIRSKILA